MRTTPVPAATPKPKKGKRPGNKKGYRQGRMTKQTKRQFNPIGTLPPNPAAETGNNGNKPGGQLCVRTPGAKNLGGRPNKYMQLIDKPMSAPEIAYKLCAVTGAGDEQIAAFFGTTPLSIWNWGRQFPVFLKAIIEGRDAFDSKVVERKGLLRRALGYDLIEETRERYPVYEYDPHPTDPKKTIRVQTGFSKELILTKTTTKHLPPDVTACLAWLNNRQKDRWTPVAPIRYVDLSAKGTIDHEHHHKVVDPEKELRERLINREDVRANVIRGLLESGAFHDGNNGGGVVDAEDEPLDQTDPN